MNFMSIMAVKSRLTIYNNSEVIGKNYYKMSRYIAIKF